MQIILRWALLLASAFILKDFLVPVLVAGLFCLSLNPLYNKAVKLYPHPKTVSILFLTILSLGLFLPLVFLSITGATEANKLIQSADLVHLKQTFENQWLWINGLLKEQANQYNITYEDESVLVYLQNVLHTLGSYGLSLMQGVLKSFPTFLLNIFIFVTSLFGFLLSAQKGRVLFFKMWPEQYKKEGEEFFNTLINVSRSVVTASLISGLLQTLIVFVFGLALSAPYLLLFCFLTFLLSFVPVVGTLPVTLFLIGLSYFQGYWITLVGYLIMFGLISIVDNFIKPLLIGRRTRLHPILAFLAALGGLASFGFPGLFVGPIVVAVLVEYLEKV